MTHPLILEVPENIYQPITEQATAEGREIGEIVPEGGEIPKPKPNQFPKKKNNSEFIEFCLKPSFL